MVLWPTPQEAQGISSEEDLASLLPEASGYDCALSRPASSGHAVRLAVRIEGPLPGGGVGTLPFLQVLGVLGALWGVLEMV